LRLKILKKLKTASLNSEFSGSDKKKCNSAKILSVIDKALYLSKEAQNAA